MADGPLLGHQEQETVSPWYHRLWSWMKKETAVQPAVQQNPVDLEGGARPPVVESSTLVAASTSTAQALVIGVQGLAALVTVLVNIHCGSAIISVIATLTLLGFTAAAIADVFGLGNRCKLHKYGTRVMYTGFFGLAVVFVLSRFFPGVFKAKDCFQSPKPEELLPFISW